MCCQKCFVICVFPMRELFFLSILLQRKEMVLRKSNFNFVCRNEIRKTISAASQHVLLKSFPIIILVGGVVRDLVVKRKNGAHIKFYLRKNLMQNRERLFFVRGVPSSTFLNAMCIRFAFCLAFQKKVAYVASSDVLAWHFGNILLPNGKKKDQFVLGALRSSTICWQLLLPFPEKLFVTLADVSYSTE